MDQKYEEECEEYYFSSITWKEIFIHLRPITYSLLPPLSNHVRSNYEVNEPDRNLTRVIFVTLPFRSQPRIVEDERGTV